LRRASRNESEADQHELSEVPDTHTGVDLFALHHCERKLSWVRQQVQRQWISALNRRGQRRTTNWTRLKACPWFDLPWAQHPHPMI
jgi:hypothetical protein